MTFKTGVFVVGCPRSGTTLLQSMLASHGQVFTLPETHLLANLPKARKPLAGLPEFYGIRSARLARACLRELSVSRIPKGVSAYLRSSYVRSFIAWLDNCAKASGKDVWVEKTPRHLYYIDELACQAPNLRFIHLIRNGEDVVASLVEVSRSYPQIWGGERDAWVCVDRWKTDVALSLKYRTQPRHTLVRYEALVKCPEKCLESICRAIGLGYSDRMLQDRTKTAGIIGSSWEPWKANSTKPVDPNMPRKFLRIFDEETRQEISRRISALSVSQLDVDCDF